MKNEIRGSEKLKSSCSDMSSLSAEELDMVAGGMAFNGGYVWEVFPHGIPWPELLQVKLPALNEQILLDDIARF